MRVIANIATHAGREKTLERTLASLIYQCDEINIYDNEVERVNLTDRGKFAFIHRYKSEPVYYFTCDDDIIYPRDYVDRTILQIEQTKGIITYHGRVLLGEGRNYYKGHQSYHCIKANDEHKVIHVPGTGVMAFRTDYFTPQNMIKGQPNKMVDLVFAKEAARQGAKIYLGIKPKDWLTIQPVPLNETIYGQEVMRCEAQSRLADEVLRLTRSHQIGNS